MAGSGLVGFQQAPSWYKSQPSSLLGGVNPKLPALNPPKLPKAGGLTPGQATLGGIGAGLEALNLGLGIWNQISAQKLAEQQLGLAKTQLDKENTRWEDREKERKANNEAIAQSANALTLPTERY
ncbi:hypothetical protein [Helicobacter sp.]|uniref:hypothetical protein n=1 Tax=Helicobacter sp. TaxID=218 RepID=UPI00388FBD43